MEALSARVGGRVGKNAARELVGEPPGHVTPSRGPREHTGSFRLVERRQHEIAVNLGHRFQQVRIDLPPDHGRGAQHPQGIGRHALQLTFEHDSDRIRERDVVEVEVPRPLPAIVEEAAFVHQLPEQLRDEERVSAGLGGKTPDEPRGRIGLAERGEHRLHLVCRQRTQRDRAGVALGGELIEPGPHGSGREPAGRRALDVLRGGAGSARQRPAGLDVAAGHNEEHRQRREQRRKKLRQLQRGLIGPLHVVHEDGERRRLPAAPEEVADGREEIALLECGGELERRGHVGQQTMERRHETRELGSPVTDGGAEGGRRHQPGRFLDNLHVRRQRRCAALLGAAAGQRLQPESPRHAQRLLREPALPGSGFAVEQHQAAAPVAGLLQAVEQRRLLGRPADQRGASVRRHRRDDKRTRRRGGSRPLD